MPPLPPQELLSLCEKDADRPALDRAALLCARARSDLPADAIVDLPLGEVTRSVLRLREATFGERIATHVDCPARGTRLEISVSTSEVLTLQGLTSQVFTSQGPTVAPLPGNVRQSSGPALARLRPPSRALLHAVHALASAYGWTQEDFLNLSPARRAAYLAMVST